MADDDELYPDDYVDLDELLAEIAAHGGGYDFFGPELRTLTRAFRGDGIDDTVEKTLARLGLTWVYWRNGDGDPMVCPVIEAACPELKGPGAWRVGRLEEPLAGLEGVLSLSFDCPHTNGYVVHACAAGDLAAVTARVTDLVSVVVAEEGGDDDQD